MEVKTLDDLRALPLEVVIRTAHGFVCERNDGGWSQMGTENAVSFDEDDFPARVLWTYADELKHQEDQLKLAKLTMVAAMLDKSNLTVEEIVDRLGLTPPEEEESEPSEPPVQPTEPFVPNGAQVIDEGEHASS